MNGDNGMMVEGWGVIYILLSPMVNLSSLCHREYGNYENPAGIQFASMESFPGRHCCVADYSGQGFYAMHLNRICTALYHI